MTEDRPVPRTAPAGLHPCQLYAHVAAPVPVRTQYHHSRPVYLQNRVYGRILHPADTWLCGLCHDAVHETIDWLLGEGRQPSPMPGRNTIAEARRTVAWYQQAQLEAEERPTGALPREIRTRSAVDPRVGP